VLDRAGSIPLEEAKAGRDEQVPVLGFLNSLDVSVSNCLLNVAFCKKKQAGGRTPARVRRRHLTESIATPNTVATQRSLAGPSANELTTSAFGGSEFIAAKRCPSKRTTPFDAPMIRKPSRVWRTSLTTLEERPSSAVNA